MAEAPAAEARMQGGLVILAVRSAMVGVPTAETGIMAEEPILHMPVGAGAARRTLPVLSTPIFKASIN